MAEAFDIRKGAFLELQTQRDEARAELAKALDAAGMWERAAADARRELADRGREQEALRERALELETALREVERIHITVQSWGPCTEQARKVIRAALSNVPATARHGDAAGGKEEGK